RDRALAVAGILRVPLPGDANLQPAGIAEPLLPFVDPLEGRREVWNPGGHRIERRAEDRRQARQRRGNVAGLGRLAFGEDSVDAGGTCQQPDERRLAFDNDSTAALFHQVGIADELNRVAQPLFSMQQDRLAGQRLAGPLLLRANEALKLRSLEAPLIMRP